MAGEAEEAEPKGGGAPNLLGAALQRAKEEPLLLRRHVAPDGAIVAARAAALDVLEAGTAPAGGAAQIPLRWRSATGVEVRVVRGRRGGTSGVRARASARCACCGVRVRGGRRRRGGVVERLRCGCFSSGNAAASRPAN